MGISICLLIVKSDVSNKNPKVSSLFVSIITPSLEEFSDPCNVLNSVKVFLYFSLFVYFFSLILFSDKLRLGLFPFLNKVWHIIIYMERVLHVPCTVAWHERRYSFNQPRNILNDHLYLTDTYIYNDNFIFKVENLLLCMNSFKLG